MIKNKFVIITNGKQGGLKTKLAVGLIMLIVILAFLLMMVFIGAVMLLALPVVAVASWMLKRKYNKILKERGPIDVEYKVEDSQERGVAQLEDGGK